VLLLRLAETAIGVTGSVIAAMLVLPTRTRTTVLTELHDYSVRCATSCSTPSGCWCTRTASR